MTDVIDEIRLTDRDDVRRKSVLSRLEADRCFSKRAVLLWDGCIRQRDAHYTWPPGFVQKWRDYRLRHGQGRLLKARSNGPPRSAFTVAGGNYIKGQDLAHLYSESALVQHGLSDGRHFTQSANLICVSRPRHSYLDSSGGMRELWLLRGLSFLLFKYDPLGAFSAKLNNQYGFLEGCTCDVVWP
jgi:hypothetical protein